MMQFTSHCVRGESFPRAVSEMKESVERALDGAPDVFFLFASRHSADDYADGATELASAWPAACSLGTMGEGVIATAEEIEGRTAVTILAGKTPDATFIPFRIPPGPMIDLEAAVEVRDPRAMLVVADPFTADVQGFIDGATDLFGACPIVGGLSSAATTPGGNRLLIGGEIVDSGMVGLAVTGEVHVDAVVSQGCRPVGRRFVITRADGNIIHELAGQSAFKALQGMAGELDEDERRVLRSGMMIGRVIDEYRTEPGRGDFLIQGMLGADPETGAIAIGGEARRGTTIQFHVRDAASADEDLRELLGSRSEDREEAAAALIFSCNGRGTRMWDEPGHDATVVDEVLGGVPSAGTFCAGEIGPVGGSTFVHGFTASIALFSPWPPDVS